MISRLREMYRRSWMGQPAGVTKGQQLITAVVGTALFIVVPYSLYADAQSDADTRAREAAGDAVVRCEGSNTFRQFNYDSQAAAVADAEERLADAEGTEPLDVRQIPGYLEVDPPTRRVLDFVAINIEAGRLTRIEDARAELDELRATAAAYRAEFPLIDCAAM